jgi:hypothetical protein
MDLPHFFNAEGIVLLTTLVAFLGAVIGLARTH